jgi:hypothetical protein
VRSQQRKPNVDIRKSVDTAHVPDDAGLTRIELSEGESTANALAKRERETFESKPDYDAPRTARRMLQSWACCRRCQRWYAAPNKKLNQGFALYCTIRCTAAHFAATGRFKGANNPRWLGGVSKDNMRYRRRQKERHPVQEAARAAVYNAVKRGSLVRLPCEVCGEPKSQGHHDDYSKPLSVRWLCRTHHDEHHARTP